MSCLGEPCGYLGFDTIDQEAASDSRPRGYGGVEIGDSHHGIAHGSSGVENQIGKVLQLLPARVTSLARVRVLLADDGHNPDSSCLKTFSHLDGYQIASAGGGDQGGVDWGQVKVPQDASSEARDVLQEHGLALPVGPHDQVMEAEAEFDDGVEAWKGSIAWPHFLDKNAAMAGSEEMNHSTSQDGGSEPICGLADGRRLGFHPVDDLSALC